MHANKAVARGAGLLYLGVAVATATAAAIRGAIVVAGDAHATAANIRASEGLFRLAIAADLASAALFLATALALYALLRAVGPAAALAMVAFTTAAAAIQALSLVLDVAALTIATQGGADPVVGVLVDLQHVGFVLSQVFFALWLLPLGWLVVQSGWFPRVLGYLLAAACGVYLLDLGAYLLAPGVEPAVVPLSAAVGAAAELGFALWLVVKGVADSNRPEVEASPSASMSVSAL